jgi:hypothetical protein
MPPEPTTLEFMLEDSNAFRFLGSARRVWLLNDPCPVAVIDYFPKAFLHCTNIFTVSTCMTTSNQTNPRLTWLI